MFPLLLHPRLLSWALAWFQDYLWHLCVSFCVLNGIAHWELLLWLMNWDMFHQREWVPGGGEKGFDLAVLLKYDCKIRIRWQSLWGRDISVCPAWCLACFGCHVINSRGWVMGDALKLCLLTLKSWGAALSLCCYWCAFIFFLLLHSNWTLQDALAIDVVGWSCWAVSCCTNCALSVVFTLHSWP